VTRATARSKHPHRSLLAGCLALAALGSAEIASAQPAGFFTDRQASQGQGAYRGNCAPCHGDAVIESLAAWTGGVDTFYGFISSAMPQDAPGSLPPATYVSILAYLLREVGAPAGTTELTSDPEALRAISLTPAPP